VTDLNDGRIGELRLVIGELDQRIVALLAERTRVVQTLTEFKEDEDEVRSPAHVDVVLARVRALAEEHQMPPEIAVATYRTLIAELTEMQLRRLAERRGAVASAAAAP
jgi:isochorismate pyruvate lyase